MELHTGSFLHIMTKTCKSFPLINRLLLAPSIRCGLNMLIKSILNQLQESSSLFAWRENGEQFSWLLLDSSELFKGPLKTIIRTTLREIICIWCKARACVNKCLGLCHWGKVRHLKTELSNVLNPKRKMIQGMKMYRKPSHNFYKKNNHRLLLCTTLLNWLFVYFKHFNHKYLIYWIICLPVCMITCSSHLFSSMKSVW